MAQGQNELFQKSLLGIYQFDTQDLAIQMRVTDCLYVITYSPSLYTHFQCEEICS